VVVELDGRAVASDRDFCALLGWSIGAQHRARVWSGADGRVRDLVFVTALRPPRKTIPATELAEGMPLDPMFRRSW